jgi:hypothetical protein
MIKKFASERPFLTRLIIISVVSIIFTILFNEATYLMQRDASDRAPQTITLVIPAGAAQQIEAGEPVPSIPEEMTFVVGDVLEVKNEDSVSHQLGPIWVPPGSSGRLVMEQAEKLSLSCSFQSSQFLGLDVRPATTMNTRLIALFLTAPTLAVLIFLYSLAAYPIRPPGAKKAGV